MCALAAYLRPNAIPLEGGIEGMPTKVPSIFKKEEIGGLGVLCSRR